MPHKVSIGQFLDDITPEGKAVGACNTIFRRGTQLVGTNTDTIGIRESFLQNVKDPTIYHGRPGMVIGGGGAARSAAYALVQFFKCPRVYLNCRDPSEVEAIMSWCKLQGYGDGLVYVSTVEQAEALEEGPGAIVSCVPNCTYSALASRMHWALRHELILLQQSRQLLKPRRLLDRSQKPCSRELTRERYSKCAITRRSSPRLAHSQRPRAGRSS